MKTKKKQLTEQQLKQLKTQLDVLGIASFSGSDGTVIVLSVEGLKRLLVSAEASLDKTAIIFCKSNS